MLSVGCDEPESPELAALLTLPTQVGMLGGYQAFPWLQAFVGSTGVG